MTNALKQGWAMHCHHDTLVEWCYDYDERAEYIRKFKSAHEVETRLRLFRLLPPEAVAEIPERLRKAGAELRKAYAEWNEAEWRKAYAEWNEADAETWHAKWCGCSEWDGNEIVFGGAAT